MAYKWSMTSSHSSDDSAGWTMPLNPRDDSVSWTSGEPEKYEWIWDSSMRAHGLPRTPTPSESSHMDDEKDGYEGEEGYGEWVSPEDCEHARRMAEVAERQRGQLMELEQRLKNSEALEKSTQNMNDMLAERVSDLSCKYFEMGLDLAQARRVIKKLWTALVVRFVAFLALLLK